MEKNNTITLKNHVVIFCCGRYTGALSKVFLRAKAVSYLLITPKKYFYVCSDSGVANS